MSTEHSEHSAPPSPRSRRIVRTVVTSLVVVAGVAGFAFFGVMAWLGMCGISGCSGGGFGRSTDPTGTRVLILSAAACLLVALLVRSATVRSLRAAGYAVLVALVAVVALGAAIGADWRGCPRSISYETCLAESR